MWVLLAGEALAAVLALAPTVPTQRWIYFGILSLLIQWIALLSLGLLYLCRGFLAKLPPQSLAWAAVAAVLAATSLLGSALWLLIPEFWREPGEGLWGVWLRTMLMITIIGILAALVFQKLWQNRQLALRAKQAELDRLRARVDPHFLFNTLNTATALIHTQPQVAEDVLLDLSDLFRAALSERPLNTLEQEVELTRRYLEIEQLRLGDRLRVDWTLPSPLANASLPTLSLQPLVENAVRHGIEHLPEGGTIHIAVTQAGELRLRVDNPVPVTETSRAPGHQIGIAATRARVESLSEGRGRVEAGVRDGLYVAEIILPSGGIT